MGKTSPRFWGSLIFIVFSIGVFAVAASLLGDVPVKYDETVIREMYADYRLNFPGAETEEEQVNALWSRLTDDMVLERNFYGTGGVLYSFDSIKGCLPEGYVITEVFKSGKCFVYVSYTTAKNEEVILTYAMAGDYGDFTIEKSVISQTIYDRGRNTIFSIEPDKVTVYPRARKDNKKQYLMPGFTGDGTLIWVYSSL